MAVRSYYCTLTLFSIMMVNTAFCSHMAPSEAPISSRKLMRNGEVQPDRIGFERCSSNDITIDQGQTHPLPSGIPTYTVEIMNVCRTGCNISGIHLSCGWFASARLINPLIFKRIAYDDCLVNHGKLLPNGHSISFAYANTYQYPLSVSRLTC